MRKIQKKPEWQKKIALERIEILFELAAKEPGRSKRYVQLARKIGMRYNVRLPQRMRFSFCRKCNSFLVPGSNCAVRLNKGVRTITCLGCRHVMRKPYHKK